MTPRIAVEGDERDGERQRRAAQARARPRGGAGSAASDVERARLTAQGAWTAAGRNRGARRATRASRRRRARRRARVVRGAAQQLAEPGLPERLDRGRGDAEAGPGRQEQTHRDATSATEPRAACATSASAWSPRFADVPAASRAGSPDERGDRHEVDEREGRAEQDRRRVEQQRVRTARGEPEVDLRHGAPDERAGGEPERARGARPAQRPAQRRIRIPAARSVDEPRLERPGDRRAPGGEERLREQKTARSRAPARTR